MIFFLEYCCYHHCKCIYKVVMSFFSKSYKLFNEHSSCFSSWELNLARTYKISNKNESFPFRSCWSSTNHIHFWILLEEFLHCNLISNGFYINLMLLYAINIRVFLMVKLKSIHCRWEIHFSCKSIYDIYHFVFMLSPNGSCHKSCIICWIWLWDGKIYSCSKLMRMSWSSILKRFLISIHIPTDDGRSSFGKYIIPVNPLWVDYLSFGSCIFEKIFCSPCNLTSNRFFELFYVLFGISLVPETLSIFIEKWVFAKDSWLLSILNPLPHSHKQRIPMKHISYEEYTSFLNIPKRNEFFCKPLK